MIHDGNKGGGDLSIFGKGRGSIASNAAISGYHVLRRGRTSVRNVTSVVMISLLISTHASHAEPNGNQDVWMTPVLNAVMRPQKERPQENIHAINAVIWTLSVEHIPCH